MAGVAGRSGGARPGAGRKSTREKYAPKINATEKKIADSLLNLVDRMAELANGVSVQEISKDGEAFVYVRPPDRQAIEYLMNRIMGKPIQPQEITGEDGGPLKVLVHYEGEATDPPDASSGADPGRF